MKAKRVKKLDPEGAAGRQRRPDRPRAARRDALVHPGGAAPRVRDRAARPADRRQAPALRARGDRVLLRAPGRDRPPARARPPGGARRAARLRRDAAPGRADHVERLRSEDADAVRERAGDAADLDPALVAQAPHRTAYRGLEVLAVHVEARRALLFDRFVELWGELERERDLGASSSGRSDRKLREARERREAAERAERAARELAEAERAEREAAERARRGRRGACRGAARTGPPTAAALTAPPGFRPGCRGYSEARGRDVETAPAPLAGEPAGSRGRTRGGRSADRSGRRERCIHTRCGRGR